LSNEIDVALDETRSRTAAHEAGHCVIAELSGLRVVNSRLCNAYVGLTALEDILHPTNDVHEAHLYVAVGGYPAVGAVLGPDAEATNREEELHDLADSDLWRALQRASQLIPTPTDLNECILDHEMTIRTILAQDNTLLALQHIAWVLFNDDEISGNHVHGVLDEHDLVRPEFPSPLTSPEDA